MTIADITSFLEPFGPALAVLFGLVVALTMVDFIIVSFLDASSGKVR